MILVKSTASKTIRIRLRAGEGKIELKPGETVKLPDPVAEQYLGLGLVEEVDAPAKRGRKAKVEPVESDPEEE